MLWFIMLYVPAVCWSHPSFGQTSGRLYENDSDAELDKLSGDIGHMCFLWMFAQFLIGHIKRESHIPKNRASPNSQLIPKEDVFFFQLRPFFFSKSRAGEMPLRPLWTLPWRNWYPFLTRPPTRRDSTSTSLVGTGTLFFGWKTVPLRCRVERRFFFWGGGKCRNGSDMFFLGFSGTRHPFQTIFECIVIMSFHVVRWLNNKGALF